MTQMMTVDLYIEMTRSKGETKEKKGGEGERKRCAFFENYKTGDLFFPFYWSVLLEKNSISSTSSNSSLLRGRNALESENSSEDSSSPRFLAFVAS